MSIIVSKNGKDTVKIDKSDFKFDEDHLQQYIYDNPQTIPLYDIKEDIRLLILAREFNTNGNRIDALGIDRDGAIYLIETKFFRNSDKRSVVAQVLDYGASLWSNYRDFEDFTDRLNVHTQKDFQLTLNRRLNDFYGISDEETNTLLNNAKVNLKEGNFKFVVLMDHLHTQLKDLIIFLNNNSEFTIYAVELEYYKHKDFEILIPKIYGAEVKKDLGTKPIQRIPTDEEFIRAYQSKPEQAQVKELFNLFNDLREERKEIENVTVAKTPRNITFYITPSQEKKMDIALSINPTYEGGGLQVWGPKIVDGQARKIIKQVIPNAELLKEITTTFGKIAKWRLKDYSTDRFEDLLSKLSHI